MSDEPSQVGDKVWGQEDEGHQEGDSDDQVMVDDAPLSETEVPVDVSNSRMTTQVSHQHASYTYDT